MHFQGGAHVFGKKELTATDRIETIIGKDAVISGSISGSGIIRVDGRIQGDEVNHGEIIVGESGEVQADIIVRQATVAGTVIGNIRAEGKVEISETGKVLGNISSVNLIVCEGAVFQGACDMKYGEADRSKNVDD
jgi:cytoskeletal protein CcmA (bactofilin family)